MKNSYLFLISKQICNAFFITAITLLAGFNSASATIYKVTNNSDSGPGSLREAVNLSNNDAIRDTIVFSDLNWAHIKISSTLHLQQPVVIDGTTALNWAPGKPVIEIDGGTTVDLNLHFTSANGSIVKGLIVNRGSTHGVFFNGSNNNVLTDCYIGTDSTGVVFQANKVHGVLILNASDNIITNTIVRGNGIHGILLENASNTTIGGLAPGDKNIIEQNGTIAAGDGIQLLNSSNTNIKGCVISGNTSYGVAMANGSSNTKIQGCIVGLNADKTAILPNSGNGISMDGAIGAITGTIIGGLGAGEGNFIGANGYKIGATINDGSRNSGVSMTKCNGAIVIGNVIGFLGDTVTAAGNSDYGIWTNGSQNLNFSYNIIGNNGFGSKALPGGAKGSGININEPSTVAIVKGNVLGLNAHGDPATNAYYGLYLNNVSNVTVGGANALEGNIISGNAEEGLYLNSASNNIIYGNTIGLNQYGAVAFNSGNGIILNSGSTNNIIGGILAGQANTIVNNKKNGINIIDASSMNNSIHRNSISCNDLRGIELNDNGNSNYAAPTIHATSTATSITGTAPANSFVEVFSIGANGCIDCTVAGQKTVQGKVYLATVTAAADGTWSYNPGAALIATVVATASSSASGIGNTSEFSICSVIPSCLTKVTTQPSNITVCENAPAQFVLAASAVAGGYKWKVDKNTGTFVSVVDDETFSGAANDTLKIVSAISMDGYKFQAVVYGDTPSCKDSSIIVTLNVDAAPVSGTIVSIAPVCAGQTASLTLSDHSGTIQWLESLNGVDFSNVSGVGTNPVYTTAALTDTIYYKATVSNGIKCSSVPSNMVKVIVNNPAVGGVATGTSPICEGSSDIISLSGGYKGAIQWQDSSATTNAWVNIPDAGTAGYTTPSLNVTTYYRALLTSAGCPNKTSTVAVSTIKLNPAFTAGVDTVICDGTTFTLAATPGFANYAWQNGAGTPSINASSSGTFWVTALAPNGCKLVDTVLVSNCNEITIPNVFTPGSDGFNDTFVILGNQPNSKLQIFNRWGKSVLDDSNYNNNWDANGQTDGVYYYIYQPSNGGDPRTGWVSVFNERL